MKALVTRTVVLGTPLFVCCAALQAQTSTAMAPASQPASTTPVTQTAATPALPVPDPQSSGPLDIPIPLWVLLGICGVAGTAGLTVSWQRKRKRQRRQVSFDSM